MDKGYSNETGEVKRETQVRLSLMTIEETISEVEKVTEALRIRLQDVTMPEPTTGEPKMGEGKELKVPLSEKIDSYIYRLIGVRKELASILNRLEL